MRDRRWWDELNLPFEAASPGSRLQEDPIAAGAVVVMAMTYDVPAEAQVEGLPSKVPGLIFRFVGADGNFLSPVALLLDAARMAGLKTLLGDTIDAAIAACEAPQ